MSFSYYRSITIDRTKVPNTDRTNFPLLISGTYTFLKTTGNGGNVQNASGYDIGFFSDAALTTPLKWETERYVASTGEVIYWVKVPTVTTATDTVIYIAYGDATITTDQSDKANVWDSNFKGVWHLPDGTTLGALDSTTNANNGTITAATAVAGQIGGGGSFNGSTAKIACGSSSSMAPGTGDYSASFWVNGTGATRRGMLDAEDGSNNGFYVDMLSSGIIRASFQSSPGNYVYKDTTATINGSAWTHVFVTWDATSKTVEIYVNGVSGGSGAALGTVGSVPNNGINIGYSVASAAYWNRYIDEVRLLSTKRSADWIVTEYNNQNSPSTFYAVGSETAGNVVITTYTSTGTWVCPSGVTSVDVETWGAGGGGESSFGAGSGGGGGGAYSRKVSIPVTPTTSYTVTVGAGGGEGVAGGDSWFSTTGTVLAKGGSAGIESGAGGAGGASASGVGDTKYSGGNGAAYNGAQAGGGGGGGAGSTGAGGNASGTTGGTGTTLGGGNGGTGGSTGGVAGTAGSIKGGGGGGSGNVAAAGVGARGEVQITYSVGGPSGGNLMPAFM